MLYFSDDNRTRGVVDASSLSIGEKEKRRSRMYGDITKVVVKYLCFCGCRVVGVVWKSEGPGIAGQFQIPEFPGSTSSQILFHLVAYDR